MNALPRWAIAALLFLLFVVLPAVSPHFGPDEVTAASDTASAARDVERDAFINDFIAAAAAARKD